MNVMNQTITSILLVVCANAATAVGATPDDVKRAAGAPAAQAAPAPVSATAEVLEADPDGIIRKETILRLERLTSKSAKGRTDFESDLSRFLEKGGDAAVEGQVKNGDVIAPALAKPLPAVSTNTLSVEKLEVIKRLLGRRIQDQVLTQERVQELVGRARGNGGSIQVAAEEAELLGKLVVDLQLQYPGMEDR